MNFLKKILIYYYENKALNNLSYEKYYKARKYFSNIYKIDPNKKGLDYNLGLTELLLKNYQQAEIHLLKELNKDECNYTIIKSLADLYYIWGKKEKAKNKYSQLSELVMNEKEKKLIRNRIKKCESDEQFEKVKSSHEHYENANNYLRNNDYGQALKEFQLAVSLDDSNFIAYNNIGTILMNTEKDYNQALHYFKLGNELTDLQLIKHNIRKLSKLKAKEV